MPAAAAPFFIKPTGSIVSRLKIMVVNLIISNGKFIVVKRV